MQDFIRTNQDDDWAPVKAMKVVCGFSDELIDGLVPTGKIKVEIDWSWKSSHQPTIEVWKEE